MAACKGCVCFFFTWLSHVCILHHTCVWLLEFVHIFLFLRGREDLFTVLSKQRTSSVLVIIIIMYIYHVLINALSTHIIHINLNMIFYTHVEHRLTQSTIWKDKQRCISFTIHTPLSAEDKNICASYSDQHCLHLIFCACVCQLVYELNWNIIKAIIWERREKNVALKLSPTILLLWLMVMLISFWKSPWHNHPGWLHIKTKQVTSFEIERDKT